MKENINVNLMFIQANTYQATDAYQGNCHCVNQAQEKGL